jgi:transketolase
VFIRPGDAWETAYAWQAVLEHDVNGPAAFSLSRQDLPIYEATKERGREGVKRGAYILSGEDDPQIVLVGTGSELHLCVQAAEQLDGARVVSMPSWEWFARQDDDYRESVLPAGVPKLSVEAGVRQGWAEWVDASVSLDRFGASAPGELVLEKLGFNVDNVVKHAKALLNG